MCLFPPRLGLESIRILPLLIDIGSHDSFKGKVVAIAASWRHASAGRNLRKSRRFNRRCACGRFENESARVGINRRSGVMNSWRGP